MTKPNAYPPAVLFQCPDEDVYYRDVAVLVSLGPGATLLTERWSDYAKFVPEANWTGLLGALAVLPLTMDALLQQARKLPCIVAVTEPLADEDIRLIEQLIALRGQCLVVTDADTKLRPEWTSVVRLPPHRSRDARWTWGMRVVLDALLNRGLVCLGTADIRACTENRLSQFTVIHSKGEGRAIVGVDRAMHSLAQRCDLSACDAFLLLFHSGPGIRLKEIHWGIQAFKIALQGLRREDYLLMVGHLPHRDVDFAVSLMAGEHRRMIED